MTVYGLDWCDSGMETAYADFTSAKTCILEEYWNCHCQHISRIIYRQKQGQTLAETLPQMEIEIDRASSDIQELEEYSYIEDFAYISTIEVLDA